MKRSIRRGVFETNSSSTHSMTIVSGEEYDKWRNEGLFLSGNKIITREEAIEELKNDEWFKKYHADFDFSDEDAVDEILRDSEYYTYNQYYNDEYLEFFSRRHTTKSGDEIVAFGKYGYDG